LKADGPGHWPEIEVLAQSLSQRQFPAEQVGFVQQIIPEGSEGQRPEMEVPPEEVQVAVETQTPRWMLVRFGGSMILGWMETDLVRYLSRYMVHLQLLEQ
jgi:hypothetical protein